MKHKWFKEVVYGDNLPPVTITRYTKATFISRTIHLDQFEETLKRQDFFPQAVTKLHGTKLRLNQSLWFRAIDTRHRVRKHDWFGNVRLSLVPTKLIFEEGIHLFIVDFVAYIESAATRVLITKEKSWPKSTKLNVKALKESDFFFMRKNEMKYASEIQVDGRMLEHKLHFIIDASTVETRHLFKECTIEAVNHSYVNKKDENGKYKSHQCLIFNGGKRKNCPFKGTVLQTNERIQDLRIKIEKEKAKSRKEPVMKKKVLENSDGKMSSNAKPSEVSSKELDDSNGKMPPNKCLEASSKELDDSDGKMPPNKCLEASSKELDNSDGKMPPNKCLEVEPKKLDDSDGKMSLDAKCSEVGREDFRTNTEQASLSDIPKCPSGPDNIVPQTSGVCKVSAEGETQKQAARQPRTSN